VRRDDRFRNERGEIRSHSIVSEFVGEKFRGRPAIHRSQGRLVRCIPRGSHVVGVPVEVLAEGSVEPGSYRKQLPINIRIVASEGCVSSNDLALVVERSDVFEGLAEEQEEQRIPLTIGSLSGDRIQELLELPRVRGQRRLGIWLEGNPSFGEFDEKRDQPKPVGIEADAPTDDAVRKHVDEPFGYFERFWSSVANSIDDGQLAAEADVSKRQKVDEQRLCSELVDRLGCAIELPVKLLQERPGPFISAVDEAALEFAGYFRRPDLSFTKKRLSTKQTSVSPLFGDPIGGLILGVGAGAKFH
jgi:hypothetical protein